MNHEAQPIEIACSLNDHEYRERCRHVRDKLRPHVENADRFGNRVRILFSDIDAIRREVEAFAELERQCCGFLTFTVSRPGSGLSLTIEGPPEAASMLDLFAELAIEP